MIEEMPKPYNASPLLSASRLVAETIHDLRSPLSNIVGFCDLLLRRSDLLPAEKQHFIERIGCNARSMDEMITRHLHSFKINSGAVELAPTPVYVRLVMARATEQYHIAARERGIRFAVNFSESLPESISLDPVLTTQILCNLVDNAFKFTRAGSIEVLASYNASTETFRVHVQDTGRGVNPEALPHIFEPFVQEHRGQSACVQNRGVGLGLSNARKMARALDGDVILISSTVGVGSLFELTARAPVCEPSRFSSSEATDAASKSDSQVHS